jgi:DNA excision repair protein ERCC-2
MATQRLQDAAAQALASCPGRTALWFPSHRMLEDWVEEGFLHGAGRRLHVERRGMDQAALARLVREFSTAAPDALLLGVLGGRLTEGIDFPGKALEHCLLLGVPYPRPGARSQALIHHFDRRAGKGWEYAVHNPTGRVLRQAIGRLIRGPDDRGTAILLDERGLRFRGLIPHMERVPLDRLGDLAAPAAGGDGYVRADTLPREGPPGAP